MGLDTLLRQDPKTELATDRSEDFDEEALQITVIPDGCRPFDNPSFHELGIVLKARMEILDCGHLAWKGQNLTLDRSIWNRSVAKIRS